MDDGRTLEWPRSVPAEGVGALTALTLRHTTCGRNTMASPIQQILERVRAGTMASVRIGFDNGGTQGTTVHCVLEDRGRRYLTFDKDGDLHNKTKTPHAAGYRTTRKITSMYWQENS